MSSWKQYFPYKSPRAIQAESLDILFDKWDDYSVFVISAPTAYGKTALAKTLMNAHHSVSAITPTNLLVDQFLEEFDDTPTLHRLDSYRCEKWDRPCSVTRGKLRAFCSAKRDGCACPASGDLSAATYRRGPGIYNYYIYAAHKLYRDVVVIDEAHNVIPYLKDRESLVIWKHDYKYPHNMWSYDQIREWINSLPEKKRAHKKIKLLREAVTYQVPTHIAQRTTELFNGKGTVRGEPEERDCIKLLPVDISQAPPILWPRDVSKIVLMSATIGPKDIEQLGLGNRRVLYLDCKSPIPPANRPIVPLDTVSVNRKSMAGDAIPKLAEEIQAIADYHSGESGMIHATYQLSALLRPYLTDSRYIFHDRTNKGEKYEEFRSTPGSILIGCGLYEGVDLPGDLGRWQVVAKIPWPSLGNPAVKHLAELDPEHYLWETLKIVVQACGRICRTPSDMGTTYICDSSFRRLIREGYKMCPDWYLDAIDNEWLSGVIGDGATR